MRKPWTILRRGRAARVLISTGMRWTVVPTSIREVLLRAVPEGAARPGVFSLVAAGLERRTQDLVRVCVLEDRAADAMWARAHTQAGWCLYAPACALVEADRARPRPAEHLAVLPGITVLDLDLPAALAVARHETWAAAHCQYAGPADPGPPGRSDHRHHRPRPVDR
ncbi:hypothetical protein SUDANB180_00722 [Streptomyces sp. enrichment culture]